MRPMLVVAAALLAGATASTQQAPQFKARTDYVTTDVIARDAKGALVRDLTMQDFVVLEDGVRQTLSHFVLVSGGQVVKELPPAVKLEGIMLPPQAREPPGRVFAIFIDDRHIQLEDSMITRRLMQQVRDLVLKDGDLVTMVSTGPSSIEEPLNYDIGRKRFDRVTAKVLANGMTPAEIIAANQTAQGPAGLRHDAHVAFSTAYGVIEQLAKIPNRRKAFIYISSGYDFNPYTEERYKKIQDQLAAGKTDSSGLSADDARRFRNPLESGGQQFAESELIFDLAALANAAQRANVTFYTADPRGLVAGPPINSNLGMMSYRQQVDRSVSSLKVLGDETGGFCLCNTNDFTRGLKMIDDAMSDYYVLGYTSSNSDQSRRRRTIVVNIARPGVTASGYRKQYLLRR